MACPFNIGDRVVYHWEGDGRGECKKYDRQAFWVVGVHRNEFWDNRDGKGRAWVVGLSEVPEAHQLFGAFISQCRMAGPLSPFEQDLRDYIKREKHQLGLEQ